MKKYERNSQVCYYMPLQCFEFISNLCLLTKCIFKKHKINILKEEMVIKLITFTRHDIFTAQFTLSIGKYLKCLTLHTQRKEPSITASCCLLCIRDICLQYVSIKSENFQVIHVPKFRGIVPGI
jgi:hypothetical protein